MHILRFWEHANKTADSKQDVETSGRECFREFVKKKAAYIPVPDVQRCALSSSEAPVRFAVEAGWRLMASDS